jgi:hypothetical protein
MGRWLLVCGALAACAAPRSAPTPPGGLDAEEFRALMERVAAKAVECFTEDALYEEPPGKQLHSGRADLFEFFRGERGTELPMHMTWHHLVFDPATQVGAGEYTFRLNR